MTYIRHIAEGDAKSVALRIESSNLSLTATFEALAEMLGLFRFINSYFSSSFPLFFSKSLFISIYLNLFVA
ncbi:hypothetical protein, partial [Vibrio parahaemolyticus]|uniref:hypothetical protein n=1 Tax=Vibrio parahaemolyticus TaxID=670 RepID=UPI00226ACE02